MGEILSVAVRIKTFFVIKDEIINHQKIFFDFAVNLQNNNKFVDLIQKLSIILYKNVKWRLFHAS